MSASDPRLQEINLFAELAETVATARDIETLSGKTLPLITRIKGVSSALLYIANAYPIAASFHQVGFNSTQAASLERVCAQTCGDEAQQLHAEKDGLQTEHAWLYPLLDGNQCYGLLGVGRQKGQPALSRAVVSRAILPPAAPRKEQPQSSPQIWQRTLDLLARKVAHRVEQRKSAQQLAHLNTYLTVSSTLAQLMALHDVLEIALYSCMEAVSAETASVLLLDDENQNFHFYHVEGPTKPILMTETFPANKGLAGSVLQSQQAEIINRVQDDQRFYQNVDSKSGFQTRNMIAVPLTAGQEQVGVLEVLNKIEGDFLEDEMMLLVLIAEEIAYAIRNSRVFELVVKSYCKQLQGQTSCKDCERPLRTWTPCVKYEEVEGVKL